jgi:hypothetical protein
MRCTFSARKFFLDQAEHHLVLHRPELELLKNISSPAHALINPFVLRLRYVPCHEHNQAACFAYRARFDLL